MSCILPRSTHGVCVCEECRCFNFIISFSFISWSDFIRRYIFPSTNWLSGGVVYTGNKDQCLISFFHCLSFKIMCWFPVILKCLQCCYELMYLWVFDIFQSIVILILLTFVSSFKLSHFDQWLLGLPDTTLKTFGSCLAVCYI